MTTLQRYDATQIVPISPRRAETPPCDLPLLGCAWPAGVRRAFAADRNRWHGQHGIGPRISNDHDDHANMKR